MPGPLVDIGQIAITAYDVDRAVAFYRDVLQLPLLFQAPGMGFFQCGAVRLMLAKPEKPEFEHPSSILYFRVANIQDTHTDLSGRGVTFVSPPHLIHKSAEIELWMAFFRDSEENLLALMSEQPVVVPA